MACEPCEQWNDPWIGRLYDELEDSERQRMDAHLKTCPPCRAHLAELEEARQWLREISPAPQASRVLVLPQRRTRHPAWSFAAGLACAAALATLGFFAGLQRAGAAPTEVRDEPVTAGNELAELRRTQNMLAERVAAFERALPGRSGNSTAPPTLLTASHFDDKLEDVEERWKLESAQQTQFLLDEITATEYRAGRWIDETRKAIQVLYLKRDPSVREH